MAEPTDSGTPAESAPDVLEGGAYDHIRRALSDQAKGLRERLGVLDGQRTTIFGSRKLEIKNLEENRVSTEVSCEPRDMIQLGANRFLFGYNVDLALKQTQISDVFSVYEYDEANQTFREGDLSVLDDDNFKNYYKRLFDINSDAKFHRFAIVGTYLYMVFKKSQTVTDITVFKWIYKEDGQLTFVDDRSQSEYLEKAFPAQYNFKWRTPSRNAIRYG